MASSYKDSSPNSGAGMKKGRASTLKNDDGREGGERYNKQDKAPFNPKLAFSPNEDLEPLNKGKDREGKEEGAY